MKKLTYAAVAFLILSSIEPGPERQDASQPEIIDTVHQILEIYGYKPGEDKLFKSDEFCVDCYIKPEGFPTADAEVS